MVFRPLILVILVLFHAGLAEAELIGVWNFHHAENGVVSNQLPGNSVHAHLKGFEPRVLQGVDAVPAPFSISQTIPEKINMTIPVAKSGWASFSGIKHNGLEPGVNTPVGKQALALFLAKDGNWIHFPGLASALVKRPGGATRTFGLSAWFILQTTGDTPTYVFKKGTNPLLRFGKQDMRVMTYKVVDRFYTEDVGNGLGGAKSYKTSWHHRESTAAKWFHLVITADKASQRFRMFINNQEVEYAHKPHPKDGYAWPARGGMQINFTENDLSDGMVIGRWLGGHATNNTTIGVASVVIVNNEVLDEKKRSLLYALGRKGIPFTGDWNQAVP